MPCIQALFSAYFLLKSLPPALRPLSSVTLRHSAIRLANPVKRLSAVILSPAGHKRKVQTISPKQVIQLLRGRCEPFLISRDSMRIGKKKGAETAPSFNRPVNRPFSNFTSGFYSLFITMSLLRVPSCRVSVLLTGMRRASG